MDEPLCVWCRGTADKPKRRNDCMGVLCAHQMHDSVKDKENIENRISWALQLNPLLANKPDLVKAVYILKEELEGCYAFQRSVNEALNRGNGSYRP
jgi:hypothetical protein